MTKRVPVAESRPLTLTEARDGGRFQAQIITPGWGSSGYYSADVLEAAGTTKVFPAGTHMYVNHPTSVEDRERPARDVRDWAGVLEADATWDGTGLSAPIRVFPDFVQFVEGRADVLGLSIRGSADYEVGEAEGRTGFIIKEMVAGTSVDFVTRAGRGGKILSLLESALPSEVVQRATARADITEATAGDIRDRLSILLRDAYGSDEPDAYVWVWLRDFDPDALTCWYEVEGGDTAGLFEHSYATDDAGVLSLTGSPTPVRVETRYVPVAPAADLPTEESRRTPMPQIEEARLRQLETDAGRVQTLEAERAAADQRAAAAEQRAVLLEARDTARPIVAGVLAGSRTLPAVSRGRVTESLLGALPMTEAGALDEPALRAAAEAARAAAETEFATALSEAGYGKPRDLTPAEESGGDGITEAEFANRLGLPRIGV